MPGFWGRWLGLFLAATIVVGAQTNLAPSPRQRLIRKYALTSANDFPARDPQDWRLLGSNDGGQTWTALDWRQGEEFPERHQRRVFVCTNIAPFNVYRLEIDRVHNPATADAVQLAGVEPIDDTPGEPDPMPLFSDALSAQGENVPNETIAQAFDKAADTKWLDFASANPATRSSWIQWRYLDQGGLVITNLHQLHALSARAAENYPLRVACVLVGPVPGARAWSVLDATGFTDIPLPTNGAALGPGQKVLLTGFTRWLDAECVVREPRLQPLAARALTAPARIELEQPMTEAEQFRWVEAEGQAQFVTEGNDMVTFDLTNGAHRLSVRSLHSERPMQPPREGSRVRVRGLCGGVLNQEGTLEAGIIWVASLEAVVPLASSNTAPASPPTTAAPEPAFTPIDQIRHFTGAELARAPHVKVRGVVTDSAGVCIQDATGGIEIWLHNNTARQAQGLGAWVEVEGRAVAASGHGAAGKGPVVEVTQIHYAGPGRLPDPIRPAWSVLASGQMDAQWVEVDGVVRATDGSHLLLACESGQLTATLRAAPVLAVNNLLDASIRVRGVSLAATDARGQMQGIELVVPSLQFIQVLQPPMDAAALPTRKIGSLPQIRGPRELIHRVKVKGLLTCIDRNNYFIQDETGGALAIAKEDVVLNLPAGGWWAFWQSPQSNAVPLADPSLRVGDTVEIVGFPETRGYGPVLTEAGIFKTDPIARVLPVKTTADDLARGELDSSLVTLEGLVQGSESLGKILVLQIQSGLRTFRALLPITEDDDRRISSGSRVRVTGVCQMEPASHAELGKRPAEFSLRLRNAADITLLELPPWLSLRRSLALVGALVVVLLAAFVWIRLLHRQVETRTRQLEQKIAEHEKTESLLAGKTQLLELEIEERKRVEAEVEKIHKQLLSTSRMAGMADVATNVLHNVGNVLNSVNVLASSIATHVKKSRVGAVSKVAALLGQQKSDLGRFMTDDPNGRHVPDHLDRLGVHLADEQTRLLDKVTALSESIAHIKEIVAMQQNYAKVSGLREAVPVVEVVEDALRMCSGALTRHQINLVRDYEDVPSLILDRHKTLQILFNLLDNAKHACWESHRPDQQITVRLRAVDDRVHIQIIDNGIGIPPANLTRIFTQGFSTRQSGHGFGLHSSILAAQEMGGTLTVTPGNPGAAFTLALPLTTAAASAN
ncbi:MAG TPA: ATP-binding protein [Verrucomicrobiae bacterium]|nr:ATP-binding protein [Verrucomicrobiae bacterium]